MKRIGGGFSFTPSSYLVSPTSAAQLTDHASFVKNAVSMTTTNSIFKKMTKEFGNLSKDKTRQVRIHRSSLEQTKRASTEGGRRVKIGNLL